MNKPTSSERLMAYNEIGKVINEARVGSFAIVQGIHDENKLVVHTGTHIFEFEVTDVRTVPVGDELQMYCQKCNKFSVPYPRDHVSDALMSAHIATCKA